LRWAARQQSAILQLLQTDVRQLPAGSTIMLDGFCRFSGPGIVFETGWDATGAVQVALHNGAISGNVLMPNSVFGPNDVSTPVFSELVDRVPYGQQLYVYNARHRSLTILSSYAAAAEYVQMYRSALEPRAQNLPKTTGTVCRLYKAKKN
jgi:hypothetical protein